MSDLVFPTLHFLILDSINCHQNKDSGTFFSCEIGADPRHCDNYIFDVYTWIFVDNVTTYSGLKGKCGSQTCKLCICANARSLKQYKQFCPVQSANGKFEADIQNLKLLNFLFSKRA